MFLIQSSFVAKLLFKQTLALVIVFQATALFQNYIPFSSHFLFLPFQAALVK